MGGFDRPPWAAGHADYKYGTRFHDPSTPLLRLASESEEEAAANEEYRARILRPVLDFLLLAAVLLPLKLWWNLGEEQCWNPASHKATELTLLRVTRGVWITWLTHAAGLLDEVLRVFLGIRLTMGLGSPTSVDKTSTKMSRHAEIVAEGIAVDDFPALLGLYAGAQPPEVNKRARSGTSSVAAAGNDDSSYEAGVTAARARVNRSLVMRVEKIAATAHLWSLAPWSSVRRYDRVHVKGMTLRLRQVKGILNFSFVALKKQGRAGRSATAAHVAAPAGGDTVGGVGGVGASDGGRRGLTFGGGVGRAGSSMGAGGQSNSFSMEDLDGIDSDAEYSDETDEGEDSEGDPSCENEIVDNEDEHAQRVGGGSRGSSGSSVSLAGESDEGHDSESGVESTERLLSTLRSSSSSGTDETSPHPPSANTNGGSLVRYAQKGQSPWVATTEKRGTKEGSGAHSSSGSGGGGGDHPPDGRKRSMSLNLQRKSSSSTSSSENLGNLGVVKVLGEAFMRRFNAYSDQVSAAFDRVSDIKVVPNLWKWGKEGSGWWGKKRGPRRRKRYEVGEIFLEDVCICVDSGVWNDLLGDQVGAAFSPEFRLSVHVGPKDLRTPDGQGHLPGDIGKLLNDKLLRLLSRLVMRETLKTSTLTSVVIASLALDTDARRRQQGRKSLSPPPPLHRGERGHGADKEASSARRGTFPSGSKAEAVDLPVSASLAAVDQKPRRFWWPFATQTSSKAAAVAASGLSAPVSGSIGLSRTGGGGTADVGVMSSTDEWNGLTSEDGGSAWGSGEGGRACRKQRSRRSLPGIGSWRRHSEPAGSTHIVAGKGTFSPPPPRVPARQRLGSSGAGGSVTDENNDDEGELGRGGSASGRLSNVTRPVRDNKRSSAVGGVGVKGGGAAADGTAEENGDEPFETVAKVPPWMEGVEASPEYDEIKPTLDVIKQTVLLAMLQQTNKSLDVSTSTNDQQEVHTKQNNGRSWGRRQGSRLKAGEDTTEGEGKNLEKEMHSELDAEKKAGGDVDHLVMKRLLAGVRDSGPNIAYKALASIELSSFLDNLSSGTRFAQHLENLGIDVNRVSRSLSGLTAGEMMEGVKDTAGKVGGKARRLRTEAVRVQKDFLDETGILPLLNDPGGGGDDDAVSVATAMVLLSDALIGEHNKISGGAGGGVGEDTDGMDSVCSSYVQDKDSWERGVAVPSDPEEEAHSVESGLRNASGGVGAEEVDQIDVIMQVLDLIDAVERLKKSIVEGGLSLDAVEQAVGKVAEGIDVYLILAASESMLGFLLERFRKLPVGQAKFAGKGFEARVGNLDLEGVHVRRENVDLVMKGFRLPKRGTPVMTKFGQGKIKRYKKRSRCFVVNLEWKLRSGKPVKAYLQPNDIKILEGHEGGLSDENVDENGSAKVTVDHVEADSMALSARGAPDGKSGGSTTGCDGGDSHHPSPSFRQQSGATSNPVGSPPPPLPSRSEKGGRWSSLSKRWNRRKSTGVTVDGQKGSREDSERAAATGVGDGGRGSGSDQSTAGRTVGRRTASTPAIVGSAALPSSPSARDNEMAGSSLDDFASTGVAATETLEGTHPGGLVVMANEDKGGDAVGAEGMIPNVYSDGSSVSTPARSSSETQAERVADNSSEGEVGGARQRSRGGAGAQGADGAIASPNSADVLSAPFLVARISGVGAELKDIKWSVKQTHFPHLRTAGTLQATLSGLTIEVELDAHDLPAEKGKKDPGGSGIENDGVGSGCGSGSGDADGVKPTGLKLTRLRVSVLSLKVHVKNNALSAVYNLAASAFEAAVKRYVVDSVEAAVRKNITWLLTIVNAQLSQKWDVLCKVGGRGGGSCGDRLNPLTVSAVEKVLATSLSHHLVWPAENRDSIAAAPTPASVGEIDQVSDQPSAPPVSSLERVDPSDSKVAVSGISGGAAVATSVSKRLAKPSFRMMGSAGKVDSAGEMSKLSSSSSSASSSSSSIPKLASSSVVAPPSSSGRARPTRRPSSPIPSSQNSSCTTLSECGAGAAPPSPPPPPPPLPPRHGLEAVPVEGTGRRVQERRMRKRRFVPSVLKDERRMSASPRRNQPRRLSDIGRGTDERDGGVSDGGVAVRQRGQGEGEDYWIFSPINTAGVMSRVLA